MSLDHNLFTLNIVQNEGNSAVQDLVLPSGAIHYHREKEAGQTYRINLFDPMSQSLLASATAPHASSKHKTIELYNPSHVVEFKSTGSLTFRWTFAWEEHTFEWKKEACYLIRKPDPAVIVAITKEAQARIKTSTVQILDYNLNRFDIADRKGLEITILTTLLTLQDLNSANHGPSDPFILSPPVHAEAPPPPPRPVPKTGIDRVAEMHAIHYEPNEVIVNEECSVENYGEYAEGLLADDAMLFITIRSATPADVPKVLHVVEQVKRLRHKRDVNAGMLSEDLHQYVVYDTKPTALQRIKLDGPSRNAYTPPSSLTVHLSKIPMPELHPSAMALENHSSPETPMSSSTPSTPSIRPPLPQARATSAPHERLQAGRSSPLNHEASLPAIPRQSQQAASFGSLWGRPRK
ncbi:hypothetical protein F5148DRAFT_1185190 [Russula earlei]|uniref:Uncharacterized protein n=1 Tax=Russula earlei TaxID=71964 RepID=A0ACC0UDS9_9AGAM|nr:hypothetical protein F5148DRAFT_1185190 [Russula earlei]